MTETRLGDCKFARHRAEGLSRHTGLTRMNFSISLPQDTVSRLALALIAGLLLIRLVLVFTSPLELYADEAQYWRWGQTLEWGYYSKPPLIAWVIAASSNLLGDTEAGVRLFAPILHAIAALAILALARRMMGASAALIAVAAYVFMPGIVLSSTVISTDGVLFPFWCIALYLLWRLREGDAGWPETIALGAAIGFAFLSKYAALYFVIGIALTSLIDPPTRRALLTRQGLAAGTIALAILAPHLAWNAANSFQTVGHTVDNANLGGELFNLEHLPQFLGDQMGVFGPISFLGLLAGLIFMRRGRDAETATREDWLACFIVPVLVIIAFQAVLSRAHANWAATAYPAACLFVASIFSRAQTDRRLWWVIIVLVPLAIQLAPDLTPLVKIGIGTGVAAVLIAAGFASVWRPVGLFWTGIALQLALTLFLAVITLGPSHWVSAVGMDNGFKRTRGWQDLAQQLVLEAERQQATAVLVDEREIWHGLDFYTHNQLDAPLILWRYLETPKNFAEQTPMTNEIDGRVLVASYRSNRRPQIQGDFASWESVGVIGVDLGHRGNGCPLSRNLRLYLVSNYAQLPRTAEWFDTYRDQHIDRPTLCPLPKD